MTSTAQNPPAPGAQRVMVLHRRNGAELLIVMEAPAPGSNAKVRLLHTATIPAEHAGHSAALERERRRWSPHHILRLLNQPVVCKLIEPPRGTPAELAAALDLIAEATLPGSIPPHRRAAAIIQPLEPDGRPARSALVVGWPHRDPHDPLDLDHTPCTAAPVVLASLLSLADHSCAVSIDPHTGAVCLAARGPRQTIIRSLHQNLDAAADHAALHERHIAPTLAAAGLDENDLPITRAADTPSLLLSLSIERALRRRIDGLPDDPAEFSDFGLAVAAGLARLHASPDALPLFSLRAQAPERTDPLLLRAARAIAPPRRAAAVIGVSIILALVGPLALTSLRHRALAADREQLDELRRIEKTTADNSAFRDVLRKRRWPMTKLLADLARAAPVGVIVESVRIETGERLAVRGFARDLDRLNAFTSQLADSRVFVEPTIDRTRQSDQSDSDASNPRGHPWLFDLSIRVHQPHVSAKLTEDFAAQSISQRLYGDAPSARPADQPESPDTDTPPDSDRTSLDATNSENKGSPTRAQPRARPVAASLAPLSDDQIATLDASTAMKEWASRRRAASDKSLDEPTRERLRAEAEKCKARMDAARKEAPR